MLCSHLAKLIEVGEPEGTNIWQCRLVWLRSDSDKYVSFEKLESSHTFERTGYHTEWLCGCTSHFSVSNYMRFVFLYVYVIFHCDETPAFLKLRTRADFGIGALIPTSPPSFLLLTSKDASNLDLTHFFYFLFFIWVICLHFNNQSLRCFK